MKFGCCVDIRNTAMVLACKDAGVDYIETSLSGLYTIPQREVIEIAKLLRENNLQLAGFNGMYPWEYRLTGEWVDDQKINSYLFEVLEKASVFCPEYVVFGSGGPRRVPEGFSKEIAFDQLAKQLKETVSPIFAQYGVKCAIEPLNYSECNIINTVLEGEELRKAADKENIDLLADFYHMQYNGESVSDILKLEKAPLHLHIASKERNMPLTGDGSDYEGLFAALKEKGYDGRISLECGIPEPFEENLRASLTYLRSLAE